MRRLTALASGRTRLASAPSAWPHWTGVRAVSLAALDWRLAALASAASMYCMPFKRRGVFLPANMHQRRWPDSFITVHDVVKAVAMSRTHFDLEHWLPPTCPKRTSWYLAFLYLARGLEIVADGGTSCKAHAFQETFMDPSGNDCMMPCTVLLLLAAFTSDLKCCAWALKRGQGHYTEEGIASVHAACCELQVSDHPKLQPVQSMLSAALRHAQQLLIPMV